MPSYDAVVLAGGRGSRLGGVDKPALVVAGRSLLDRVLDALPGAGTVVAVGPARPTARPVRWHREDPPGGGPVAALAAALPAVSTEVVVVLAADLPALGAAVPRLVAALAGSGPAYDGVVLVDGEGRRQPLLAAYRTAALREALARVGRVEGASMRRLVAGLSLAELGDAEGAALDVDTPADVARAEARLGARPWGGPMDLQEWTALVSRELGIDPPVDVRRLLDFSRVAAHSVDRPAAPLTTYLVGWYAAQHGGTQEAVESAMRRVEELAAEWAARRGAEGGAGGEAGSG